MPASILATKLYIPPPRPNLVDRPRLIERLNAGLASRLTLISAPAGFGKTTVLSAWASRFTIDDLRFTIDDLRLGKAKASNIVDPQSPIVNRKSEIVNRLSWLSLDSADNDVAGFLTYLISALQTVSPGTGQNMLGVLQSPQSPPAEVILTDVLNEITNLEQDIVLVLDDYHVIDSKPVDQALAFLLEHQPPQLHLVIATREDPDLPLARYRGRGHLTELRAADLRFTPAEAAEFLNQAMGLSLSSEDVAALETRTEGWIAGLQLAALSMQGVEDARSFIQSFTGSHHFVMDYLVEEVLGRQSPDVQAFLLRTSMLERMCGPLCDAVLEDASASGQTTLERLEQANLFIVPLDSERRWYRYHHLFRDLLRQRLGQKAAELPELHRRASQWYEAAGLGIEAFHHATAANDIERALQLMQSGTIPLHSRGAIMMIVDWLGSLPPAVLDERPWLWWRFASFLLIAGINEGVEEKLQAAERGLGPNAETEHRDIVGNIAAARATLALTHYDVAQMIAQSRRALEYLPADNPSSRSTAYWSLGYAYILAGDRRAARLALTEGIQVSRAGGAPFFMILSTVGLGNVQEFDNELKEAAATYGHVLELAGQQPLQIVSEAQLGLARVHYEWNDLEGAERHGQLALQLSRQYDVRVIDRHVLAEIFLARLQLARGDVDGAAAMLAATAESVRERNFVFRKVDVAAAQIPVLIRQGKVSAAAELAAAHSLPLGLARVKLANRDAPAALAVLEAYRAEMESRGWHDERLKAIVLQALAHRAQGDHDKAQATLTDALRLAETAGFVRLFVDEGQEMKLLISDFGLKINEPGQGTELRGYVDMLAAAFDAAAPPSSQSKISNQQSKISESLSQRETDILNLLGQGLSNKDISMRLFLALDTVKGYNRSIFGKLGVRSRAEAVVKARELGLL